MAAHSRWGVCEGPARWGRRRGKGDISWWCPRYICGRVVRPREPMYWLRRWLGKPTASNLFNLRLCSCWKVQPVLLPDPHSPFSGGLLSSEWPTWLTSPPGTTAVARGTAGMPGWGVQEGQVCFFGQLRSLRKPYLKPSILSVTVTSPR